MLQYGFSEPDDYNTNKNHQTTIYGQSIIHPELLRLDVLLICLVADSDVGERKPSADGCGST